jgi:hypothetical protein
VNQKETIQAAVELTGKTQFGPAKERKTAGQLHL